MDNWIVDEVMQMHYDGYSVDEIANELGLSPREVSNVIREND